MQAAHASERDARILIARADGERERVEKEIVRLEAISSTARKDAPGNGDAAFNILRDAAFIQRERNDYAAIARCKREYGFHAALFAADRVDNRFSIVNAQCAGKRFRIRRIKLKRKIGYGLELLCKRGEHGGLVQFRQASVYIKRIHALLLLQDAFAQNQIIIPVPQGLLHARFARWVDALADEHRLSLPEADGTGIGTGHRAVLFFYRRGREARTAGNERADMLRRSAAAATHEARAALHARFHQRGKFFRPNVKHGFAFDFPRKPCVGLEQDGQA